MSSRKLAVLNFVKGFFAQHGASPSYGEIAAAVGVNRKIAHQIVEQLSQEAQLIRTPGKTRGLGLPDPVAEMGEADALLRLRKLGYVVNRDALVVVKPGPPAPETNKGLHGLPFLDHQSDVGSSPDP